MYENINFYDHKDYIKVKDICFLELNVLSHNTQVFSMSVEISNREEPVGIHSKGNHKKKKKSSLLQKRGSVAELSDQQSGLFSKCWRVLTEFSKLPFGREASVHRKLKFPSWSVRLRINQSPERDIQGFFLKKRAYN